MTFYTNRKKAITDYRGHHACIKSGTSNKEIKQKTRLLAVKEIQVDVNGKNRVFQKVFDYLTCPRGTLIFQCSQQYQGKFESTYIIIRI